MCHIFAAPSPSLPRNSVGRNVLLDFSPDPGRGSFPWHLVGTMHFPKPSSSDLVKISPLHLQSCTVHFFSLSWLGWKLSIDFFKTHLILRTILWHRGCLPHVKTLSLREGVVICGRSDSMWAICSLLYYECQCKADVVKPQIFISWKISTFSGMNFRFLNSLSSVLSMKPAWWGSVVSLLSGSPDNSEREGWFPLLCWWLIRMGLSSLCCSLLAKDHVHLRHHTLKAQIQQFLSCRLNLSFEPLLPVVY